MSEDMRKLLIESQFQIDEAGGVIGVSRQALSEFIGEYDGLKISLADSHFDLSEARAQLAEAVKVLRWFETMPCELAHDDSCCLVEAGISSLAEETLIRIPQSSKIAEAREKVIEAAKAILLKSSLHKPKGIKGDHYFSHEVFCIECDVVKSLAGALDALASAEGEK